MFLRLFKGFKYPCRNLVFSFSQASPEQAQAPANEILNSLLSIPVNLLRNGKAMNEVSSFMKNLENRYHELTQSEILKLAAFASNGNVMKSDLHDFLANNLMQQMKSNLCNITDMSMFMRILSKNWSQNETVLITKYIEERKEELTPNTVASILNGIQNITLTKKEIADLIDRKAFEFIRYMNINQLVQICYAMLRRQINTPEFWERVEKKIMAQFFFLHPKDISCFCDIFAKNSQASQKFWKAAYDAIEASTSNYENIKFFFPFLAENNKGNPGIWNKYEEMIVKKINQLSDLVLLENIAFMTKAEKKSFIFWKAININLVRRIKNFDHNTQLMYFLELSPFENCFLIEEIWTEIMSEVFKNSSQYSELDKMKISNILRLLENKEKLMKKKKEDEKSQKAVPKITEETKQIDESTKNYQKKNIARENKNPTKILKKKPAKNKK